MTTFLLVPGGWQGGWVYEDVVRRLRALGHDARALTLTGLDAEAPAATGSTNLDTHIEDVVAALRAERADEVVLCGHSYGGMVITGAADRAPERLAALVYLDAYVPADRDSCWTLTTQAYRDLIIRNTSADGHTVAPSARLDPRSRPHPLASFVQAIRLDGDYERVPRRTFVYLTGWSATPFAETYERLRDDPAWTVHTAATGHDVMAEDPERVVAILTGSAPPSRSAAAAADAVR